MESERISKVFPCGTKIWPSISPCREYLGYEIFVAVKNTGIIYLSLSWVSGKRKVLKFMNLCRTEFLCPRYWPSKDCFSVFSSLSAGSSAYWRWQWELQQRNHHTRIFHWLFRNVVRQLTPWNWFSFLVWEAMKCSSLSTVIHV